MAEEVRVPTLADRVASLRFRQRDYKRHQRTLTFAEAKYWINQWRRLANDAIDTIKKMEDGPQYGD